MVQQNALTLIKLAAFSSFSTKMSFWLRLPLPCFSYSKVTCANSTILQILEWLIQTSHGIEAPWYVAVLHNFLVIRCVWLQKQHNNALSQQLRIASHEAQHALPGDEETQGDTWVRLRSKLEALEKKALDQESIISALTERNRSLMVRER